MDYIKPFEYTVGALGFQRKGYAGAFSPQVHKIITEYIESPCLHLFSGRSLIGDERVDLTCEEATLNCDVFDYLKIPYAKRQWKWCVLDPPYAIPSAKKKLEQYKDWTAVSTSVPNRRALNDFFIEYVQNIMWLDLCAPLPRGFERVKLWFLFPGGYRHVRILSWLRRNES